MADLKEISIKLDKLREDVEQVRRHSKAEYAAMNQLISGERGLVKSINTLEDVVDDITKFMVKYETKQSINSVIFGMIGSGLITLIGALIYYLITNK